MAQTNFLDNFFHISTDDSVPALNLGISQPGVIPRPHGPLGPNFQLGVGVNAPVLDVTTPLVLPPTVCVILTIPQMYMTDDGPSEFGIFLKELMESHAKSISGLDFNYSLDSAGETPVGHDSQNMSVPGKTKRSSAQPSFTFQELQGNMIHNAFLKWITDISPADHYASMAATNFPGAWCMSAYSMSMVAIQFDPTMLPDRIIDAAFYSNMWPQGTGGDVGFERQIGSMRFPERSITFSSIVHHNPYTKLLGIEIAHKLKLHTVDYNVAPPYASEVHKTMANDGIMAESNLRTENMLAWQDLATKAVGSTDVSENAQQIAMQMHEDYVNNAQENVTRND